MTDLKVLTRSEYKIVYDTMYASLCLFANKYVEDLDLAKDIVQEVFIKIWEDKVSFQNQNTIKSYLYSSVRNRSINYINTSKFKATQSLQQEDYADVDTDPFFVNEVLIAETTILINTAIDTLPKKCAIIIKLSLLGRTNPEIADELGLSLNTIKAQKKIAYKKLKPFLKEYFVFIAFLFEVNN